MFHVCLLLKEGKGVLGSEKHYPVRNISVVWCGQLLQADTVIDQVFVAAWVQRPGERRHCHHHITSGHQQIEQLAPSPHHHKKLTPGTADPRLLLSRPGSCSYKDKISFVLFCISWPLWVTASKTFLSYLHRKQSSVLTSDRPDQSCDLRPTSSASYY